MAKHNVQVFMILIAFDLPNIRIQGLPPDLKLPACTEGCGWSACGEKTV
jgi:hypothetical protein